MMISKMLNNEHSLFNPLLKLFLILISIASSYLIANELPNLCSRDKNINEFTVLSYHEIADKSETLDSTYAVTPSHFEEQIHWLMYRRYSQLSKKRKAITQKSRFDDV